MPNKIASVGQKAAGKIGGKRGAAVYKSGRGAVAGGKQVVKAATRGDVEGVYKGARKTVGSLKKGYKPAKKLAGGVAKKFKKLHFLH